MDIRTAILKAADHIEANPHLFDFSLTVIPACGAPGCALGWIGHFLGQHGFIEQWDESSTPVRALGLMDQKVFYDRLYSIASRLDVYLGPLSYWCVDSYSCARLMREYADEYHPAPPAAPALDPAYVQLRDSLESADGLFLVPS